MGLLSSILLAPFTGPVNGALWTMEKVQRVVEEQLTDDTPIKEELMQLQLLVEAGELDDAQYVEREADVMRRLREVRAWREQLGMGTSGGPVRMAREE